jgi:biotin carboxylase
MVLGAGIYQVPLIRKARAMGIETIVVSYAGNYPGFSEANRFHEIDTTDADAVLEAAREERIDGIVTTGTDVSVPTVGHVCDALGLPGISASASRNLTDKAAMKESFRAAGVSTSPFEVVGRLDEARRAAIRLGLPVMVKACDVSGSRGITKVSRIDDLDAAYQAATNATHADHIVVEKFVSGTEIGVDGFVSRGSVALFAPHEKFVRRAGAVTIPSGHSFPLMRSKETRDSLFRQVALVVEATGMDECAFNGDVMVLPDGGVSIIEMGGRCGATCIPELISMHLGFDYYAQMIRAALGEPVRFDSDCSKPCMAKLLFSDVAGTVETIDLSRLRALERSSGARIGIDVAPGDHVHAVHDGTDRFGQVIMATDDESELDRVLASANDCIRLA